VGTEKDMMALRLAIALLLGVCLGAQGGRILRRPRGNPDSAAPAGQISEPGHENNPNGNHINDNHNINNNHNDDHNVNNNNHNDNHNVNNNNRNDKHNVNNNPNDNNHRTNANGNQQHNQSGKGVPPKKDMRPVVSHPKGNQPQNVKVKKPLVANKIRSPSASDSHNHVGDHHGSEAGAGASQDHGGPHVDHATENGHPNENGQAQPHSGPQGDQSHASDGTHDNHVTHTESPNHDGHTGEGHHEGKPGEGHNETKGGEGHHGEHGVMHDMVKGFSPQEVVEIKEFSSKAISNISSPFELEVHKKIADYMEKRFNKKFGVGLFLICEDKWELVRYKYSLSYMDKAKKMCVRIDGYDN